MNINGTISKEEWRVKVGLIVWTYRIMGIFRLCLNIFILVFGAYLLLQTVKSLICANATTLVFYGGFLLLTIYLGIWGKIDYKKQKSAKYVKKLSKSVEGRPREYTVAVDDEKITVNDSVEIKWEDVVAGFLMKNYMVIGGKKKIRALIPTDLQAKEEICRKLFGLKKCIYIIEKAPENKTLIKPSVKNRGKTIRPVLVGIALLMLWILYFTFGYDPGRESSPGVAALPDKSEIVEYNRETGIVSQACHNVIDGKNVYLRYYPYFSYITKDNNTVIKESRDEKEIWFFDGDKPDFGLKLSEKENRLTYYNGETATVFDLDYRKMPEKENIQAKTGMEIFADLCEYNHVALDYPVLAFSSSTAGGSRLTFDSHRGGPGYAWILSGARDTYVKRHKIKTLELYLTADSIYWTEKDGENKKTTAVTFCATDSEKIEKLRSDCDLMATGIVLGEYTGVAQTVERINDGKDHSFRPIFKF